MANAGTGFISNRELPPEIAARFNEIFEGPPLMAVMGDLSVSGCYAESALAVSGEKLAAIEKPLKSEPVIGGILEIPYTELLSVELRRMYGNIVFYAYTKTSAEPDPDARYVYINDEKRVSKKRFGKRVELLRTSYAMASVCDAIADYVNARVGYDPSENLTGQPPKDGADQFTAAENAFKKAGGFCPKCGFLMQDISKECLRCSSKKSVASKLYKYLKPGMKLLYIGLLLSVITTAAGLAPPYLTKILVDSVLPEKDMTGLIILVVALVNISLWSHVFGAVKGYIFRIVSLRFVTGMKKDVYAKSQYLSMNFYDKATTGSVMNRINGDTGNISNFVMNLAQNAIAQLFTMVGIIIVMFVMDWRLTLISLVPVPVLAILSRDFGKKIWPLYMRLWRRSTAISSALTDTVPGIKIIKTFTGEQRSIRRFGQYVDDAMKVDLEVSKVASIYPWLISFLVVLGSHGIWLVGGLWIIGGTNDLTLGLLMAFISYTWMFYAPVNYFLGLNESYNNTLVSVEKVMEILDAEPEGNLGKGKTLPGMKGKIEFKGVSFSFDRSKKVITNASFVIEPGDVVGIVGTTGAGKSTLVNLLMRFYDKYEGEILVDDVNIKDIDMDYFRSQIGYVQQEPMMFRDTVYYNIVYADPSAGVEQVMAAAEIANAHQFISKFPDGYDTFLGERGIGLSGGEKQRVSIARAVLRNPSILVFDEATSAVDSETEKLIQEAIEQIITGRTTLMIAHRLSTLRKANKIIVVDRGNIIEFGTPDELMALEGKYYKLIQIQTMSEQVKNMRREERFEE
jgi:ATP-binding cassette subfamily B protein